METTSLAYKHNDCCSVCSYGGVLLCCDTCNQVFHHSCLIPKMDNIPEGMWSCQWCILDDELNQKYRRRDAKRLIDKMMSEKHQAQCQKQQELLDAADPSAVPIKKESKSEQKKGNRKRSHLSLKVPSVTPEKKKKLPLDIHKMVEGEALTPLTFIHPTNPSEAEVNMEKVRYAKGELFTYLDCNGELALDKMLQFISEVVSSRELLSIEIIFLSVQLLVNSNIPMVHELLFLHNDMVGMQAVFIRWFQAAINQVAESQVERKDHIVGVEIMLLIIQLVKKFDFKSTLSLKKFEAAVDLRCCAKQAKQLAECFGIERLYKSSCELFSYLDNVPKQRNRKKSAAAAAPAIPSVMATTSGYSEQNANDYVDTKLVTTSAKSYDNFSVDDEFERGLALIQVYPGEPLCPYEPTLKPEIIDVDADDNSCITFQTQ
jgi:hypothetical protein